MPCKGTLKEFSALDNQYLSEGSADNKLITKCIYVGTLSNQPQSVEKPDRKCYISLQLHHRGNKALHNAHSNQWDVCIIQDRAGPPEQETLYVTNLHSDQEMRILNSNRVYENGFSNPETPLKEEKRDRRRRAERSLGITITIIRSQT